MLVMMPGAESRDSNGGAGGNYQVVVLQLLLEL